MAPSGYPGANSGSANDEGIPKEEGRGEEGGVGWNPSKVGKQSFFILPGAGMETRMMEPSTAARGIF